MKHLLLICGSCLLFMEGSAQNQMIVDSLQAVLETTQGGDRFPPLYDLAFEYLDKDNNKALAFIERAEQAALLSGDSLWIVKSKRVRGQILYKLERTDECIPLFENASAIANRNGFTKECMMILNSVGISYLFRARFDKALSNFVATKEMAKQLKNSEYFESSLNNIGVTYYQLRDFRKAIAFFLKRLEVSREMRSVPQYNPYINISLCYTELNEYSKARLYLDSSINKCGSQCADDVLMYTKTAAGLLFYKLKEHSRAMREFSTSLGLAKKIKRTRIMLDDIAYIAKILIKKNKLKEAKVYLEEGERIVKRGVPFPDQVLLIYSGFSDLYIKLKDYRKLASYQSKYIDLNDSIYNRNLTTRLMTAEAEFRERENRVKIESQNRIISLNQEIIARQKLINIIVALLALVTLTFSIFLFNNFRQKKNVNRILEEKIRQRTHELELSRDELLKVIREKEIRINRACGFIAESVNTIAGLCLTARKEISDPITQSYLARIYRTSDSIEINVRTAFQDHHPLGSTM